VKRHRADLTKQLDQNYTDKPDRLAEPLNYTNTFSKRSTEVGANCKAIFSGKRQPDPPTIVTSVNRSLSQCYQVVNRSIWPPNQSQTSKHGHPNDSPLCQSLQSFCTISGAV
jgi:hypothetical protein